MLWLNKNGKLIMQDGHLVNCDECPCQCEPFVIAKKIVNWLIDPRWDLRPYKYKGKYGNGSGRWRLADVGEAHYNNPNKPHSGLIYGWGEIGRDGELIGLPDEFVPMYAGDSYMQIEEGCYDEETGNIIWNGYIREF
jgi:hypothetical protein